MLFARWGRYLLVGQAELDWSERFFERRGGRAVLVGHLLPVIRTFIAVPAGLARMLQPRFQAYTLIGSWPWCFGLACVGYALGERWNDDPTLRSILHRFDVVIVGAIILAAGYVVGRKLRA